MTKNEVRQFASQYGIEANYSGNTYEDRPKGFFFNPTLLNNLTFRLSNLIKKGLKDEIEECKKNIEVAKEKVKEFMETEVYKNSLNHEAPII